MLDRFKKYRLTHDMFVWWIILEVFKLLAGILIFVNAKAHMFYLPGVGAVVTIIVFKKSFVLFKSLLTLSVSANDLRLKTLYEKIRNNLFIIFVLDLLPFIPFIQAFFRVRYLRLFMSAKA